VATAARVVTS